MMYRFCPLVLALTMLAVSAFPDDPPHVQLGLKLVEELQDQPAKNCFAVSNFTLRLNGIAGATDSYLQADSPNFAFMLITNAYGWAPEKAQDIFPAGRLWSSNFYEAIVRENGFRRIKKIEELRSGDIIVVDYVTGDKRADQGQVLIAVADYSDGDIRRQDSKVYRFPQIRNTYQYLVKVMDATGMTHAGKDTRTVSGKGGALGMGILRLYLDNDTKDMLGYTWEYNDESMYRNSGKRPPVIGRL